MNRIERRFDGGGLIFGIILVAVGVWYLLENTFGIRMPRIDSDQVWPVIIIGLGVAVLYRAWQRQR